MKPTAYIVCISRGDIIDDDALIDALKRGEIAGPASTPTASNPSPPARSSGPCPT